MIRNTYWALVVSGHTWNGHQLLFHNYLLTVWIRCQQYIEIPSLISIDKTSNIKPPLPYIRDTAPSYEHRLPYLINQRAVVKFLGSRNTTPLITFDCPRLSLLICRDVTLSENSRPARDVERDRYIDYTYTIRSEAIWANGKLVPSSMCVSRDIGRAIETNNLTTHARQLRQSQWRMSTLSTMTGHCSHIGM